MINIVECVKQEVKNIIGNAIEIAVNSGEFPKLEYTDIAIEIPREKEHGEFSTNIAMKITKQVKKAPSKVAQIIINNMDLKDCFVDRAEVAGNGFINFYLNNKWLYKTLIAIQSEKEDYGKINIGNGQRVMVEFVSANPTGPLHMGNARGGALGDLIASVFENAGYDVTREFYINDAGNQIEKFGTSLEARYFQILKGEDFMEFPEDGYHGADIIDHMKDYIALYGDKLLEVDQAERRNELVTYALPKNLERIKQGLLDYGIEYDVWFSEQSLFDSGDVDETLNLLKDKGYSVEKEGAIWFSAPEFGIEKDEVIVRNNGIPTYFTSDIAYHRNKFQKRNFDRVINLLGADHHGHVARMKAGVSAIGSDAEKLDIILFQLVHLYKDGEKVRMSKRTGRAISLSDLLEEVGRDAARFFFNMKASGSHLDFDLDLAVSKSNDNPVYYVQYAHARICSMMKLVLGEGVSLPNVSDAKLELLTAKEEIELIKKLAQFPEEISISVRTLEPSRLTRYIIDVAGLFHSFYNACHIKGAEENLMNARLILVDSTRIVINNVLTLLKISAPERM